MIDCISFIVLAWCTHTFTSKTIYFHTVGKIVGSGRGLDANELIQGQDSAPDKVYIYGNQVQAMDLNSF